MKNILFLSTHNFASNPRMVKEIRLALNQHYQVTVICFEFRNWSYEMNQQIKKDLEDAGTILHIIEAGRKPFGPWLFSLVYEKIAILGSRFLRRNSALLCQAISRRSVLLLHTLTTIKKADIVVGHNPGALWPTLKAAQKFKCKAGFDVEDYHPGEGTNSILQQYSKKLMLQMLPAMNYVSFASDPIRQYVLDDWKQRSSDWFTVLNYFPANEFVKPLDIVKGSPVKMVWFSQNIDAGRGLELIIPYIKSQHITAELHLFGNLNDTFFKNNLEGVPNIFIHLPVPQQALHHELASFDIGLALEPAKDLNNDLAISNKMMAYLQAGLFVVATDTLAQSKMLLQFPDNGIWFSYAKNNIEKILEQVFENIEIIRHEKETRYREFAKNSWENESTKLVKAWEKKY